MKQSRISGFTLIELSIVLVIIGLIVGGVLVGRDLINVAKLRKVVSGVDKFTAAIQTFRAKYNCMPGDCKNATTFFTNTSNGNADGKINLGLHAWSPDPKGFTFLGVNTDGAGNGIPEEVYLLNEHLAYAKLIPLAPFDHTGTLPSTMTKWCVNLGKPGWNILALTDGHGRNLFRIAASDWGAGYLYVDQNVKMRYWPDEAFYIDSKMDDGLPLTGSMIDDSSPGTLKNNGQPSYIGCEKPNEPTTWYTNAYNIPRTSNAALGGAAIAAAPCNPSIFNRF